MMAVSPLLISVGAAGSAAGLLVGPGADSARRVRRLAGGAAAFRRPPDPRWGVCAATALVLVLAGWLAAVIVGVAGLAAIAGWRGWRRARLDDEVSACAGDAFAAVADELRAGRTPAAALLAAGAQADGELGRRFRVAAGAVADAADPAPLVATGEDAASDALRALCAVLACRFSGAALADVLDRLADAARAEHRGRAALRAELAGPRATAMLLSGLPLIGLALAGATGAHPLRVLLHTRLGAACFGAGALLDGLGAWWCARLARAAARP